MVMAETQEDAENQVRAEAPQMRVLRAREIDLSDLPPLACGPLPNHWVVVVEHRDPKEEAKLPQQDDPEDQCERETRLLYLKLAVDPDLLIEGVIEEFPCPACEHRIRLELPPPPEGRRRTGTACPACRTPLKRSGPAGSWEVAPPIPKAPAACVFCDERANSREHAIPKWISKRLGIKDFLSADEAFIAGGLERPKRDISFANYRSRIFCTSCNTHFKALEDEVIPLLEGMARGRTLSLNTESQALLALWAHKTAIALLAASPDHREAVPVEHRLAVRDNGRAGPDTWVSFFAWWGGPVLATGELEALHRGDPGIPRNGYLALLSFARVGFCVIGFEPVGIEERVDGELAPLRQFWPPRVGLQHWPPPAVNNGILPTLLRFVPLRRA
jgi:hypothetical protein